MEVVLGKYNSDGSVSYDAVAKNRGSTYFNLDDWNEVQNVVGKDNMWKINEQFLEQQFKQGKSFVLTHNPLEATGYYAKEIEWLRKKGFDFVKDGSAWRAIK